MSVAAKMEIRGKTGLTMLSNFLLGGQHKLKIQGAAERGANPGAEC